MRIDLSTYLIHLPTIRSMLKHRGHWKELVSDMSIATECPVIVCLYYVAHIQGMDEELEKSIKLVKDFYKVEEIKSWPLSVEV